MSKVWVVGDVATDLILSISSFPRPGGDVFADGLELAVGGCGSNIAVSMTKFGPSVHIIAQVGDDQFGRSATSELKQLGVEVGAISFATGLPTHTTVIMVTDDGERTILGYAGASRELKLSSGFVDQTPAPNFLIVSGYALFGGRQLITVRHLMSWAKSIGIPVLLDVPVRLTGGARTALLEIMPMLDTLVIGCEEASKLSGSEHPSQAAHVLSGSNRRAVVKSGNGGVSYVGPDGVHEICLPYVDPVDSTGAGDAFVAGLVGAQLEGMVVRDVLLIACLLGASATLRRGAGPAMPGPAELLDLISGTIGGEVDESFRLSRRAHIWLRDIASASENVLNTNEGV
jgi:ribokinase